MRISIRDRSAHSDLERAFEIAQNLGFGGMELSVGGPDMRAHPIWRREGLMRMTDYMEAFPMRLVSAHIGSFRGFGLESPNGAKLFQALLPRAAVLGVSALTVQLSARLFETERSAQNTAETLRSLCAAAGPRGFAVQISLPLPAAESLRFVESVGAENLGIDYDILYAARKKRRPAEELQTLAGHVLQIRARDENEDGTPCPIGMGVAGFEPIAEELRASAYSGEIVLDTQPGSDAAAAASANLANVQEALLWAQPL